MCLASAFIGAIEPQGGFMESEDERDLRLPPHGAPAGVVEPPAGVVEPPAGVVEPPAGVVEPPAGVVEPPAGVVEGHWRRPVRLPS
ncbi:MAG: hypothetical protein QM784_19610 [Polyangiaceae bacterium]